MIKTIKLELSKRLKEEGILDDIETKYVFAEKLHIKENETEHFVRYTNRRRLTYNIKVFFKTLTFDEAIEILPRTHLSLRGDSRIEPYGHIDLYRLTIFTVDFNDEKWGIDYISSDGKRLGIGQKTGKTKIEAVEKMLEYLLDNNLLKNN